MGEQYVSGKNWGTDVIDQSRWIDVNKPLRTRSGRKVICPHLKLYNSHGDEYTFPIKGSIDNGPRKQPTFCIWTLDGRVSVLTDKPHKNDLVQD